MDDFFDVVIELFTEDDGGPVGRSVKKGGRILRGAVESSLGKGVGPLVLTTRAVDYTLGQIGVEPDSSPRRQIRAELNDLDRYGGFGVRVLDQEQPEDGVRAGPTAGDAGPEGRPDDGVKMGIVDP